MKKTILVLTVLAVVSFGVSLGVAMWMNKSAKPAAPGGDTSKASPESGEPATMPASGELASPVPSLKEKQLDDLIHDVRARVDGCKKREAELDQRQRRLEIAQEMLKKQADELENLRVQLVAPLTSLKQEQQKLKDLQVVIEAGEMANLKKTAAIYEKMEAPKASAIIEGMCSGQQEDDAARILHYMSEKSAAKLMQEFSDKTLGARLTEKLKRIKEEAQATG